MIPLFSAKIPMKKTISIALLACTLIKVDLMASPTFQEEIRPIVQESCVCCHGAKRPDAGFRAEIRAEYLKNSGDGPWVIAGDSSQSPLMNLLCDKSKIRNKRDKHALSPGELATIRKWIDAGAN